jgi:two-component system, NarL family, sensor histidine kinase DesK
VPGAYSLPPAVDALLAWTVREGATNILRHSTARHAEIVIDLTDTEASARLSDDGAGPRGKGLSVIAGVIKGGKAADGNRGSGGAAGGDGAAGGGPPADAGHTGSGLAGLAERAARLGGALSAGGGEDGGFWLRVSVPLTGTLAGGAAEPGRSASSDPTAPPNASSDPTAPPNASSDPTAPPNASSDPTAPPNGERMPS